MKVLPRIGPPEFGGERIEGTHLHSPAPKRRAAVSTPRCSGTTPDAHTAEGLRPRGRREEINMRREEDQRRMDQLQMMQLEVRAFVRKARTANPQSIVEVSMQEAQRCGYTACGNCGS